MQEKRYLCIDLKSFYASVECVERNLNPMTTNLVVADSARTEKTICLAVTPALKRYGISGRARLFEIIQKVRDVNALRKKKSGITKFSGKSCDNTELDTNPGLEVSYITAVPRMALYIKYSAKIYEIYMEYFSAEDIHVYSIDEVFIDVTGYLKIYKMSVEELAKVIVQKVLNSTGITATVGIGTNMYLAKVAMDIMAKRMPGDKNGVRIAQLDEMSYRRELWSHRPLTDFWRIGRGYAKKLESHYLYTMGDIARCSLTLCGENMLYRLLGVNAELLIDHAWGWEPCSISDIKAYKPRNKSVGSGQVLQCPYEYSKAKIIVREMTEALILDLAEKKLITDQISLTIGYDAENMKNVSNDNGKVTIDYYGRKIPKSAHGTANLERKTASQIIIIDAVMKLYTSITDKNLLVRRVNISANHITDESEADCSFEQLDLFSDFSESDKLNEEEKMKRERIIQDVTVYLRRRFGKNTILRGYNLLDGAMAIERNGQIGGHKA